MRELLAEALCKVHGEIEDELRDEANAADPYRVAVSVESAMFEKWGRSNGAQKLKYRSIMFNIKDAKNPDFRRKVLLGYVKPERILELTPEEMASTERQMEIGKIKEKALFDCERGLPPKATTDEFRCGRCGKRKCTYYQLQTRSADEPMTTFVTCVNCDNHWKFC
uniref:Transcription elongation factor n=1 Tax=Tanacetum cinerariifolium TaxID=118510 RepID=A0A699SK89_TANCI|nr:transcription elongation factor TFIIS-like [Tanacetum cinerariifolium]